MRNLLAALCTLTLAACSNAGQQPAQSSAQSEAIILRASNAATEHKVVGALDTLEARDVVVDADGSEHVRFDRKHRDLRVLGGDFVAHRDLVTDQRTFSGALSADLAKLDVRPELTAQKAVAIASKAFGKVDGSASSELVINALEKAPALAYEVVIAQDMGEDQTPTEMHYLIDARTGAIQAKWDGIETTAAAGSGRGFFVGNVALTTDKTSATSYALRDPSRGNQYTTNMNNKQQGNGTLFTDADNTWGDNTLSNAQTVGVDAQFGTAMTWDYYLNVHGRNGIANNGAGAFNRVHYGRRYNNAYWSDSCFCMTYGDGDGTTFNPFDSLDVAGHEMTHGVTSRTANLTYSGESGGLNEATSDIFGTMVEFYANSPSDAPDYKIGEKLYKTGTKALRYMYNPAADGASANCWSASVGSLDVHYSSGVGNHFFYLLAEGSNPTNGNPTSPTCNSSSVTGIGRDAAAKIYYRALTVYFTSSTNYAGARTGTLQAAADLYGAGSAEQSAVAAAWSAVNVN